MRSQTYHSFGLLVAAVIAAGLLWMGPVVGSEQVRPIFTHDDPCFSIESRHDFESLGLRLPEVPALLHEFEPISFSCASTYDVGAGSRVRGIFTEFADEAGTAIVVAVIHEDDSVAGWVNYLSETFHNNLLEIVATDDRTVIGVFVDHARSDALSDAIHTREHFEPLPFHRLWQKVDHQQH